MASWVEDSTAKIEMRYKQRNGAPVVYRVGAGHCGRKKAEGNQNDPQKVASIKRDVNSTKWLRGSVRKLLGI